MCKHSKDQAKGNRPSGDFSGKPASKCVWIGIDLGDRWSEVCELDAAGVVRSRGRVRTTPAAFRAHFEAYRGAEVAMETGTHSGWASRLLGDAGLRVTVANAREIRKIHQSDRKNDRSDAAILARMLRFDRTLLSPIYHRSAEMQAHIALLRARDVVVRTRSACINTVRGSVKALGGRLPACSAESFARRASNEIPPELQPALGAILELIATTTATIRAYDRRIEALGRERYPQTALLTQVAGVGPVTSLAFVLTLSDPQRFSRSRDVGTYFGLVPRQYDSGQHQSQLPISKAGNAFMRRLLVQSAQYILGPFGPDCRLRRFGERLMLRGGKNAKKRAVVAVARKLAILLHYLWSTGAVYEPFHDSVTQKLAA